MVYSCGKEEKIWYWIHQPSIGETIFGWRGECFILVHMNAKKEKKWEQKKWKRTLTLAELARKKYLKTESHHSQE